MITLLALRHYFRHHLVLISINIFSYTYWGTNYFFLESQTTYMLDATIDGQNCILLFLWRNRFFYEIEEIILSSTLVELQILLKFYLKSHWFRFIVGIDLIHLAHRDYIFFSPRRITQKCRVMKGSTLPVVSKHDLPLGFLKNKAPQKRVSTTHPFSDLSKSPTTNPKLVRSSADFCQISMRETQCSLELELKFLIKFLFSSADSISWHWQQQKK